LAAEVGLAKPRLLFIPSMSPRTRALYPARHLETLRDLTDVTFNDKGRELTAAELAEAVAGFEIAITSWKSPCFAAEVVARADRLRLILHSAGTVRPFVSPAVFERGIVVTSSNAAMSRVTAEAALALMILGSWDAARWIREMERGGWKSEDTLVPGLQGKRIGIIGYGAVTRALLPLLANLENIEVSIASRHLGRDEAARLGVRVKPLETLLAESDVVSLQTSLTPGTRRMIDGRRLALMRDGALLVNVGRGELVDEESLIAELARGRIRAALDVYDKEPPDPASPLRRLANVTCLPHLGAATTYCREAMGAEVLDNLRDYLAGRQPRSAIGREQALRMSEH
jgi:phosphoglycerate dehydrogenase-like enzyme